MIGASCILFYVAVALTHQAVFKYVKPWDPFRRTNTECEMCYNGDCFITNEARCEYYAETSKVLCDDDIEEHNMNETDKDVVEGKGEERAVIGTIDSMLFELIDTASSTSMFKICVPFISQYTDCSDENICLGCKFCTCSEEGKWVCTKKHQCRPGPKVIIDHRVVAIAVDSLRKKAKPNNKRYKRSAILDDTSLENQGTVTYNDISKWLYGAESFHFEKRTLDTMEIVDPLKYNYKSDNRNVNENFLSDADTGSQVLKAINNSAKDVDFLEFNDILKSLASDGLRSEEPKKMVDETTIYTKHNNKESNDDLREYDPIRLVKRDTSNLETNRTQITLEINSTSKHFANIQIIKDTLYGLNKIIHEKQKELDELLHIRDNMLKTAKLHNTTIDINSANNSSKYNNHQIAIYKIDAFEKCVSKLKHDIYYVIEKIIKAEILRNSTNISNDMEVLLGIIKKYVLHKHLNNRDIINNFISSQESKQDLRRHMESDTEYQIFNPLVYLSNILAEVNKVSKNPLNILTKRVRKILKRAILQLYFDDFSIIDLIVHETHYDFNNYLESIGIKWNKMMQDIADSEVSDKLHRTKLLHMTLQTDVSKIEDIVSLLEFAQHRRMSVANGNTIEKSIQKIKNNLKLIDSKVQQIIKLQNMKHMRNPAVQRNKPVKKLSMMQKLKKMFQNSKNDIKHMLRKKMPKSEIIKEIVKKKLDELEKQRMTEYQETIKEWQDKLNIGPERRKRSAWGFQNFVDRIKSIIPGYLKKKVKPAIDSKRKNNKTRATKMYGK